MSETGPLRLKSRMRTEEKVEEKKIIHEPHLLLKQFSQQLND